MQQVQLVANPFALMMNPEAVFAAIAESERLGSLHSRICRPLDKPILGQAPTDPDDASLDVSAELSVELSAEEIAD